MADRWKVTPDQVILGNGSDEILGLLARTFLSPGDEAVMADHTFVIYKMEVMAAHGEAVTRPAEDIGAMICIAMAAADHGADATAVSL